ncbi:uracil-DNA glycosylase family protein [Sphingobacterium sp. JB170]|uniref:uracil-DNA glycosylase family protein n=1 Tax=Sphingobacterium sp. JB170 TaxID=1434842 RepID=UPI00097EDAAE|nr:uracil-DNA glycosylase family protein [Sphingobacterium sp. JB170]SJN47269.1 Hypothetical protein VC0266 (sugar utilization related?) [Sphingobacterium sp. JB170]
MFQKLDKLVAEIGQCRICESRLPCGANPVFSVGERSKILIIGQAPGLRVHKSRIPWDDLSGKELRRWLGVSNEEFYNTDNFGILPMGFCYPGKAGKGDLPPRPECAPQWHGAVISSLLQVELVLLIGQYAQAYYLKKDRRKNLTQTVLNWEEYLPHYFPLPHPSPRNFIWRSKNPWFDQEIIPNLQMHVRSILSK